MSQNKTEEKTGKFTECSLLMDFPLLVSVCKKSKNIQKSTSLKATSKRVNESEKKYKTFDTSQKTLILLEIQKKVLKKLNQGDNEKLGSDLLLKFIQDKKNFEDYNKILKSVLKVHVRTFKYLLF